MKNIVIISDTHSNSIDEMPLSLVYAIKNADIVIHAGDSDTPNFINELEKICKQLYAVKGNCDTFSSLPEKLVFEIDNIRIGLCHGAGRYDNIIDRMYYLFNNDNVDIIMFGHIHHPVNEKIDNIWFLNSGSPNHNRKLPYGTYALLQIENDKFNTEIVKI